MLLREAWKLRRPKSSLIADAVNVDIGVGWHLSQYKLWSFHGCLCQR